MHLKESGSSCGQKEYLNMSFVILITGEWEQI